MDQRFPDRPDGRRRGGQVRQARQGSVAADPAGDAQRQPLGHATGIDHQRLGLAIPIAGPSHAVRQGRRPRTAEEAVPHTRAPRRADGPMGLRASHSSRRHRRSQGVHPRLPLQHRAAAPLPPIHARAAGPRGRRPDRGPTPRRPRRPPGRDTPRPQTESRHRVSVRSQRRRDLRGVRGEQAGVRGQARVRRHRGQRDHRRVQAHVVVQAARHAQVLALLRLSVLRGRGYHRGKRGREAGGYRGLRVRPDLSRGQERAELRGVAHTQHAVESVVPGRDVGAGAAGGAEYACIVPLRTKGHALPVPVAGVAPGGERGAVQRGEHRTRADQGCEHVRLQLPTGVVRQRGLHSAPRGSQGYRKVPRVSTLLRHGAAGDFGKVRGADGRGERGAADADHVPVREDMI